MTHEMVDGKLRNLDKTWRHLSMKQRDWIVSQFRETYIEFLNNSHRHPNREECRGILDSVYAKIQEREIWIPYGEAKKAFSSKLSRYRKIQLSDMS